MDQQTNNNLVLFDGAWYRLTKLPRAVPQTNRRHLKPKAAVKVKSLGSATTTPARCKGSGV